MIVPKQRTSAQLSLAFAGGTVLMGVVSVILAAVGTISNLMYYVAVCASFFLGAGAVFLLPCAWFGRQPETPSRIPAWTGILLGLAIIVYFYIVQYAEVRSPWYVGRGVPRLLVACAGAVVASLLYAKFYGHTPGRCEAALFAVYSAVLSLICGYLSLYPFISHYRDIYNFQAYTHDIYNVYNGVAYTELTSGLYGHYGLFFAPLLALMGGLTVEGIAVIIAVVAAITMLLVCRAVIGLTSNPWARIALPPLVLLPYIAYMPRLYVQAYPARLLPGALFCFLLWRCVKKKRWGCAAWRISGVFALLWSTDFGMLYAVAVFATECITALFQSRETKQRLRRLAVALAWLLAELACAVFIVNIYNLCVGGGPVLGTFFYPLGSPYNSEMPIFSSTASELRPLPFMNLYFWITVFYIGCFLRSIYTVARRGEGGVASLLLPAASVFGLGSLVYYYNRPEQAYLFTTLPLLILCLALITDRRAYSVSRRKPRMLQYAAFTLAAVMSLEMAMLLPGAAAHTTDSLRRGDTIENVAEELSQYVKKDTYAVGSGSKLVYTSLGWDTQCPYDSVNVIYHPPMQRQIYEEIKELDEFVDFFSTLMIMSEGVTRELIESDFEAVHKYYVDVGYQWTLYRRKPV